MWSSIEKFKTLFFLIFTLRRKQNEHNPTLIPLFSDKYEKFIKLYQKPINANK